MKIIQRLGLITLLLPVIATATTHPSAMGEGGTHLAQAKLSQKISFNIEPQSVGSALTAFGKQSGLAIVMESQLSRGLKAQEVVGSFTAEEALSRILAGTSLRVVHLDSKTVQITSSQQSSLTEGSAAQGVTTVAMVQDDQRGMQKASLDSSSTAKNAMSGEESAGPNLNAGSSTEVVVTGTRISGAPVGSPVLVFTREDIDRTGVATVQQFIDKLPQNFGSMSEHNASGEPGISLDGVWGTGVDLRGLSASATLVLIDGRRQAPSGFGNYVDTSMIPLSAVERIEIVTDGASAIYGSDAIGGVVNFILKKGYTGAQTRLYGGMPTEGGAEEWVAAQSVGTSWGRGNGMFTFEHQERNALPISKRRELTSDPSSLLSGGVYSNDQRRNSLGLNLRQELTSSVALYADAAYSEREASHAGFSQAQNVSIYTQSKNETLNVTLGTQWRLPGQWAGEVYVTDTRSSSDGSDYNGFGSPFVRSSDYEMKLGEATLTGSLIDLPAGPVRLAVGGAYRKETYDVPGRKVFFVGTPLPDRIGDRSVGAVFAELRVPLLRSRGASNDPLLAFSMAGRHEDYDDVGTAFSPKFGVEFTPLESLKLRASFSDSFKAPLLQMRDASSAAAFLFDLGPPLTSANTRMIQDLGSDPQITPETSKTTTVGIDVTPPQMKGFKASLTWYSTRFKDRIANPDVSIIDVLGNPAFGDMVLQRGEVPDAQFDAIVSEYLSGQHGPPFFCQTGALGTPCAEPASNFSVIFLSGFRNIAVTKTSGLDLLLAQSMNAGPGSLQFDLNATYTFEFKNQLTPVSTEIDQVDTSFNPLRLRMRGSVGWRSASWDITGFLNYRGAYSNTRIAPPERAPSYLTTDLTVQYRTGKSPDFGFLRDLTLNLSVNNLLDRDPPILRALQFSGAPVLFYDSSNANPYGRVVGLTVSKNW